jgi:putative intracellular protease/amidase
VVPFLVETELVKRGAKYSKAPLWGAHVVTDGRLVTGQNPASAKGVGQAVAALLKP